MFNATKTIVAAAALAATVSLVLVPATAQAGGFSFGIDSGDAGMTMSMGGHMNFGPSEDDNAPSHDLKFYNDGFAKLNADDDRVHVVIDTKGYNVLLQQAHDCLQVKKIKLLFEQMEDTRKGYVRIGDATGEREQAKEMKYWREVRLPEAKADCAKNWF